MSDNSITLLSLFEPEINRIILDNKHYLSDLVDIKIVPPCFDKSISKIESSNVVLILIGTNRYDERIIEFIKNSLYTYDNKTHIIISYSKQYSNAILNLFPVKGVVIFQDMSNARKSTYKFDSYEFVSRLSKTLPLKVHIGCLIIIEQSILLWRLYGYNEKSS